MKCLQQLLLIVAILLSLRDSDGDLATTGNNRSKLAPTPDVATVEERLRLRPVFVGGLGDSLDISASNTLDSLVPEDYVDNYSSFTAYYSTVINSNTDAATVLELSLIHI